MAKNKKFNEKPIESVSDEKLVEASEIETENLVEETDKDKIIVTDEPAEVEAIVSGVETALNIRKEPEVKANNQIGIVGKGTKIIVVDPEKPIKKGGEEWYKVRLNGEPGYAMKKYIKVI